MIPLAGLEEPDSRAAGRLPGPSWVGSVLVKWELRHAAADDASECGRHLECFEDGFIDLLGKAEVLLTCAVPRREGVAMVPKQAENRCTVRNRQSLDFRAWQASGALGGAGR